MAVLILQAAEVQDYIRDRAELNLLLNAEEYTPSLIELAMELAISAYNMIPPVSVIDGTTFPSKALLMEGTLAKLMRGQMALKARNYMQYTDGGLTVPVEEQFELYQRIAVMYEESFMTNARNLKTHLNIESGWGSVMSDYSSFPEW